MFAYLKGVITEKNISNASLVIELNGIGYLVHCNHKTLNKVELNQTLTLYTSVQANPDGDRVYGLLTKADQGLFEALIRVSSVGPKAALNILNVLNVEQLTTAIIKDEPKIIAEAPGVGLKTAKRIILELKNKLGNITIDSHLVSDKVLASAEDVVPILNNLGFNAIEIDEKLSRAVEEKIPDDPELLMEFCLRN